MNIEPSDIVLGFGWYLVFVFSTCFHEAAHALAAYKLGDSTAYHGGQVTLNPTPHIQREPLGMVVVPLLSFFYSIVRGQPGWMIGWASAPYDARWANRHPKRAALMALAGPAANLVLFVIAGACLRIGSTFGVLEFDFAQVFGMGNISELSGIQAAVGNILGIFFVLNLVLCVFNLMPLPPLDGSALPPLFLSWRAAEVYTNFVRQPGIAFIGLIVAWNLFPKIFWLVAPLAMHIFFGPMF